MLNTRRPSSFLFFVFFLIYDLRSALQLLDTCMKRCGPPFHAEVGKFRFLNEMIKLVSPKYLGGRTTTSVRQRVLQLLYAWIREYPRESKIKEAYEMLKKQGVVEVVPRIARSHIIPVYFLFIFFLFFPHCDP